MSDYSYLDFDLALEKRGEQYRAWVVNSPAGQAEGEFSLPFTEIELENFILRVGRPRTGTRRIDSAEMQTARRFGQRLFEAVFGPDEVYGCFRSSLDSAAQQGKGLRLRLRINSPELNDLPWEYLYNPRLNRFLSLSNETPVVRYLDVARTVPPLKVDLPMRMLVMISSPGDLPPLDVEREWSKLGEALKGMEASLVVDRLEVASLDALQRQLRRNPYHILHFIGHGGFDEQFQDGVLYMESESGRGRAVNGQTLGTLLADQRSLRLVVLNACEGARTSQSDPFAGVAQSLVQQGLPAVIAMQFEITDEAAITLAHEFYSALIEGAYPVDAALSEARKAIFAQGNDIEWGTPVYFSRAADGYIFNSQPLRRSAAPSINDSTQIERDKLAAELYNNGLSAYYVKDWERAVRYFNQLNALKANFLDAAEKQAEAEKQLSIRQMTEQAEQKAAEQDWSAALQLLRKVAEIDPRNLQLQSRLVIVERQAQLVELYEDAQRLHQAGRWQAVLGVFEKIHELEPAFNDPQELQASAQQNLVEVKRQQNLLESYRQALEAMNRSEWQRAEGLLAQVVQQQADYQDAGALLQRAREELNAIQEKAEQELAAQQAAEHKAAALKVAEQQAAEQDAAKKAEKERAEAARLEEERARQAATLKAAELQAEKEAAEKSTAQKAAKEAEAMKAAAMKTAQENAAAEQAAAIQAAALQAAAMQAAVQKAESQERAASDQARSDESDNWNPETIRIVNQRNQAAEAALEVDQPARMFEAVKPAGVGTVAGQASPARSVTGQPKPGIMQVLPDLGILGIRWQAWAAALPGGLIGALIGGYAGYLMYEWSFYFFKDTLNLGYEGADLVTGAIRLAFLLGGFLVVLAIGAISTSNRWQKAPPVLPDGRLRWLAEAGSLRKTVLLQALPVALIQAVLVTGVILVILSLIGLTTPGNIFAAVIFGLIAGGRKWWMKSTEILRGGVTPDQRKMSSSRQGSMGISSAWLAALPGGLHTAFWVGIVSVSILTIVDTFSNNQFGYDLPDEIYLSGLGIITLLAFLSSWAKGKTEISRRWFQEPPYLDDGRVRWLAELSWLRAEDLMRALPGAVFYAAIRAGLIFAWLNGVYYLGNMMGFYLIDGDRIMFYTQVALSVYFLRGWWLKSVALRKKQP